VSIVAATLLIASGAGYRLLAGRIDSRASSVLPPNKPLTSIPPALGPWRGEDAPLDERLLRLDAMDDQYLNRVYVNNSDGQVVTAYVGYVGRAHRWLVHRPDICFPAHGRQQVSEEEVTITVAGGKRIPCILHEFRSPDFLQANTLVLSSYIFNGRYTADKHIRNASLFTEQAPYLTRIQLGTALSHDKAKSVAGLRDLLSRLTEPLGAAMPYIVE
jgi:EpsI family protein